MAGRNQIALFQQRRPGGRCGVEECVVGQGVAHIFHLHRTCCLIQTERQTQNCLVTTAMLRGARIGGQAWSACGAELKSMIDTRSTGMPLRSSQVFGTVSRMSRCWCGRTERGARVVWGEDDRGGGGGGGARGRTCARSRQMASCCGTTADSEAFMSAMSPACRYPFPPLRPEGTKRVGAPCCLARCRGSACSACCDDESRPPHTTVMS